MRVTRHPYDVPGWGVGEVWVRDGIVVQHELAFDAVGAGPRSAGTAEPGADDTAKGERGPRGSRATMSFPPNGGARRPAGTLPLEPTSDRADFVPDLCRRVAAHLAGTRTTYEDVPIDLDWATELQHCLADAARAVPWGEVVSYGELAALAGRPRAARAAGSFCAENRFALIIPCHRVVASDGIGGYGEAGPALKRRLLALEGVHL